MFTILTESLAPEILLLKQESYIFHIWKDSKRDIANYKLISLLNLDYKIYTNSFESNAKNI